VPPAAEKPETCRTSRPGLCLNFCLSRDSISRLRPPGMYVCRSHKARPRAKTQSAWHHSHSFATRGSERSKMPEHARLSDAETPERNVVLSRGQSAEARACEKLPISRTRIACQGSVRSSLATSFTTAVRIRRLSYNPGTIKRFGTASRNSVSRSPADRYQVISCPSLDIDLEMAGRS
jgi:hypothetical protein